jgi:murein DD-endopeptidase MepM/ murein hydrolase activator NlpD
MQGPERGMREAAEARPDRRILIQTADGSRQIRIGAKAQILIGAAALAMVGWLAATTAQVAVSYVAADSAPGASTALREAYEARLDLLSAERDQRAAEAASAQERFRAAMDRISRQQAEILAADEARREFEQKLASLQTRLADAQITQVASEAEGPAASGAEMASTLTTVTQALGSAVAARDAASAEREALSAELADAELELRVTNRRQEEMVAQLREAVAGSAAPLEGLLEQAGLDADAVLAKTRSEYDGAGGPLIPVGVSSRSFPGDATTVNRFDELMVDVDRMNLLRTALGKVPYATPVFDKFRYTSPFGVRRDPMGRGRRMHTGIDFAAPRGTPIHATADGVVISAKSESGYGQTVRIQHDFGFETVYAHQSRLRVKAGQRVSRGDHIGDMGSTGRSTGSHLHYEVLVNGRQVNPMTYVEAAKDVF